MILFDGINNFIFNSIGCISLHDLGYKDERSIIEVLGKEYDSESRIDLTIEQNYEEELSFSSCISFTDNSLFAVIEEPRILIYGITQFINSELNPSKNVIVCVEVSSNLAQNVNTYTFMSDRSLNRGNNSKYAHLPYYIKTLKVSLSLYNNTIYGDRYDERFPRLPDSLSSNLDYRILAKELERKSERELFISSESKVEEKDVVGIEEGACASAMPSSNAVSAIPQLYAGEHDEKISKSKKKREAKKETAKKHSAIFEESRFYSSTVVDFKDFSRAKSNKKRIKVAESKSIDCKKLEEWSDVLCHFHFGICNFDQRPLCIEEIVSMWNNDAIKMFIKSDVFKNRIMHRCVHVISNYLQKVRVVQSGGEVVDINKEKQLLQLRIKYLRDQFYNHLISYESCLTSLSYKGNGYKSNMCLMLSHEEVRRFDASKIFYLPGECFINKINKFYLFNELEEDGKKFIISILFCPNNSTSFIEYRPIRDLIDTNEFKLHVFKSNVFFYSLLMYSRINNKHLAKKAIIRYDIHYFGEKICTAYFC